MFPKLSADKVRWMRLYCTAAFGLGVAASTLAGSQDYSSTPSKPSYCYKQHLKTLRRNNKITEEKYRRLLTGADM
ncbi:hypothetical protein, conserved [Eimeria acervulina]|uniref:Uncharacterized protein n=1 Tax=Eimeria acervulina TaxID=5801 RepID=U6G975_EIMAC|nr:hypothetical protein, conserved [Eimeria acervulina]CDI76811.1 hypothetical protein, conserved [Eimeria acervulina]